VPGHFPKDRFALAEFDGTCLYEHEDRRIGEHREWGTLIFNYGRHEVSNFLICSALSWCERYHIDGFRVDAVAAMVYRNYGRRDGEWLPNGYGGAENVEAIEFLRALNVHVHGQFPGVMTIAEESTSFSGVSRPAHDNGLGFDFKWDMGWMHDTLNYFSRDPIHRKYAHNRLTFAMLYQYTEHFILALSHDEVVHGKGSLLARMPSGDMYWKASMLRSLYGYMWTWPGKKSLFMGGEFGQHDEWCHFRSLDWHILKYLNHEGLRRWVRDLNLLYRSRPWLGFYDDEPQGFRWVNPDDGDSSVLSFLRLGNGPKDILLVVCNFTPIAREHYRVGVPANGLWREVLNGDALYYGGGGTGNCGWKETQNCPCNGCECSFELFLPPHSTLIFEPYR
jgi:1,4-alpha-glucan branching enzyme